LLGRNPEAIQRELQFVKVVAGGCLRISEAFPKPLACRHAPPVPGSFWRRFIIAAENSFLKRPQVVPFSKACSHANDGNRRRLGRARHLPSHADRLGRSLALPRLSASRGDEDWLAWLPFFDQHVGVDAAEAEGA